MDNIGTRLKSRRLARGLNQKVVASAAGVTNAAVSKWETHGGESMSAIVALRLSRHLNVNPFWLVFGEGEPNDEVWMPDISAEAQDLARRVDRLHPQIRAAISGLLLALSDESCHGRH